MKIALEVNYCNVIQMRINECIIRQLLSLKWESENLK